MAGRRPQVVQDTELRFSVSCWRGYHIGVLAVLVAVTFAACAVEALALWGGPAVRLAVGYELILGCIVAALAITTLLVLFANLWEAARTWVLWRQFRQPAVVVGQDGVRFQPRGREVRFGWDDIEELVLHQYHHGRRAVVSVSLRLARPAARTLSVGDLDQIGIPAPAAIATLHRLAGPRITTRT